MLSDLLKDKSNVTIQYGTAINKVLINLANNIYGIEDFKGNVYYADKTILCMVQFKRHVYYKVE